MSEQPRIAELERLLEHEVERYLNQLMLREQAEARAGLLERQLHGQVRGNAKLLAQLKAQGAVLRSFGVDDHPIGMEPSGEDRDRPPPMGPYLDGRDVIDGDGTFVVGGVVGTEPPDDA